MNQGASKNDEVAHAKGHLMLGLLDTSSANWRQRLDVIVATMREMSSETDPQAMVRTYGKNMRKLLQIDGSLSLSRRGLTSPRYRVTRSTTWKEEINPWKEKDRLPILEGGLLGKLIYSDAPHIIDHLEVAPGEPAAEYLAGQSSLMAIPMFDKGVSLNMVVLMRREPAGFPREHLPEWVWLTNLFGRATHNLVLAEELQKAYNAMDHELKVVGDIQRSLLPAQLPHIPTMDLAASYQTSQQAGGDYYDFFPLPEKKWGIFLADVSGHGTPAAVLMAITHCIAHTHPGPPTPPGGMLAYLNHQLLAHYTAGLGSFVTAFYGIYDPARRQLTYASAGHNPPRLKHCGDGSLASLDGVGGIPLGISERETYEETVQPLKPGDQIVFYTDGVTEAHNAAGEMFGLARLDQALAGCRHEAAELLEVVLQKVAAFTAGQPVEDDRTVLVARIS
jgi:sigma-B regulation protein RsbU (phosphoserine phosphatase)